MIFDEISIAFGFDMISSPGLESVTALPLENTGSMIPLVDAAALLVFVCYKQRWSCTRV